MGRPKGSKDKKARKRRFYRKPEDQVVVAPPEETKTQEAQPPLDGAQTETPVQ